MPAPTVTAISPRIGSIQGGAVATITGANFTGTSGVTIGGAAAMGVTVVNDTTITCTTPAGSVGVGSVLVTNGSGTNGANALFIYIPSTPVDTYIYLRGGRGDGFVSLWTGEVSQEDTLEQGDPYRNTVAGTVTATGVISNPGYVNIPTPATQPIQIGGVSPVDGIDFNLDLIIDDQIKDAKDGDCPPRKWTRTVTWLCFTAASGLVFKFRKPDVIGWGSNSRT